MIVLFVVFVSSFSSIPMMHCSGQHGDREDMIFQMEGVSEVTGSGQTNLTPPSLHPLAKGKSCGPGFTKISKNYKCVTPIVY